MIIHLSKLLQLLYDYMFFWIHQQFQLLVDVFRFVAHFEFVYYNKMVNNSEDGIINRSETPDILKNTYIINTSVGLQLVKKKIIS